MITVENLNVKLNKKTILENINVEFTEQGRVIGLFGPNGAGKTTFIKTLVQLIQKYEGRILGNKTNEIAYMPDQSFLYSSFDIKTSIQFFNKMFKDFDSVKAARLMKELRLNEDQKIKNASKGMKEQIHMALILSRTVPFYIMDEPLASVDPSTREYLMELILKETPSNSNVLISTHLIDEVEELFDEVMMINDGKLMMYENKINLKQNYEDSIENVFKKIMRESR